MFSYESDTSSSDFEVDPLRRVKSRRDHAGAASPGRRRGDGGGTRRIVVVPPGVLARMGDIVRPAPDPAAVSRDSSSRAAPTPAAPSSPDVEFIASVPPEDEVLSGEGPQDESLVPYEAWMYEEPSYLGGYFGTGFSAHELRSLPDFKPSDGDPLPEDPTCSICKEDMVEGDPLKKLTCDHVYHKDCILPWFGQSKHCPLCRVRVEL